MKNKRKKRILLVTQYFYPEGFKSNDIAFELAKKGYSVSVLTGIPNYPQGKFFKGYGLFRKRIQNINGVKVYRSLLFPRLNGGGLYLALNYMSWAFFASIWAFFLSIFNKYDLVLVHQTSPVLQGIPAVIVKRIRKIPLYFWVLDLWPESLISAGGVTNKSVIGIFEWITKCLYKESDKILISSRGFRSSILQKCSVKSKIEYFPNWAEDVFLKKECIDLDNQFLSDFPAGFIVMFAGNIGEAQDFESIMKAALELKQNTDIKFVFVGDGRKKKWVDNFIAEHELNKTCYTLGRYPLELMPLFYKKADIMLVSLKDELIFNLTAPAKIQSYMASAKPILTMLNGEGSKLVQDASCGLIASAGDYKTLAQNIRDCAQLDGVSLELMGNNAKDYFMRNFNKEKCINNLISLIEF